MSHTQSIGVPGEPVVESQVFPEVQDLAEQDTLDLSGHQVIVGVQAFLVVQAIVVFLVLDCPVAAGLAGLPALAVCLLVVIQE